MLQANLLLHQKMETEKLSFEFGSVGLYYQECFGTSCGAVEKGVFSVTLVFERPSFFFFLN